MFKWLKKHCKKLIIASSILTACVCGLFGYTRSYAYELDNNNHLVGNNIDSLFVSSTINTNYSTNDENITYNKIDNNTLRVYFHGFNGSTFKAILDFPNMNYQYGSSKVSFVILLDTTDLQSTSDRFWVYGLSTRSNFQNSNYVISTNKINCNDYGTYCVANSFALSDYLNNNCGIKIQFTSNTGRFDGYFDIKCFAFDNYNINYVFDNDTTFYPYSSIEQLQQDYDTLQQQYNDYVASHSYSNTQYNDLVSANSSLQQQLSSLQLQYNTYVATHSHTNEEYNELRERLSNLQENYSDLHDELLELQSDYDDLQNSYNTMKTNYDTLNSSINYGIFAYIEGYNYGDILYGGVEFYGSYENTSYRILPPHYDSNLPGNSSYMWTFDELIEEGLLENGGILRIDKITDRSDYNSNVNYNCHIALNHMPITSFYLDVQGMNGAYIQVKDYNSQPRTVSFTTNSIDHTFTYQNIYSVDSQFGNVISDIYITPQFTSSSILGQAIGATSSIQSYNNGYNDGVNFMSYYKNEYDIISREYESARRDIATLRELNESLNEQLGSNLGWKSLFFAMADTPLKTVSNVLGFELFGVNLFTTFIGMLTVLGIVFLLKKLI